MMVKEGERLDGRQKAEDAFGTYVGEDVDNVAAADPATNSEGELE